MKDTKTNEVTMDELEEMDKAEEEKKPVPFGRTKAFFGKHKTKFIVGAGAVATAIAGGIALKGKLAAEYLAGFEAGKAASGEGVIPDAVDILTSLTTGTEESTDDSEES